jgi:ribosomal RNA assembly protein
MKDTILIPERRLNILRKNKKWKEDLEQLCNVKVEIINDEIEIESKDVLTLLRAKEVLKAFGRGFPFDTSLNLLDEDYYLEVINLRDYTRSRNRMIVLKGRVIGRNGRIKKIIERETGTKISVYGKTISILGKVENVQIASRAVRMILEGKKHGTVLSFLEGEKIKIK